MTLLEDGVGSLRYVAERDLSVSVDCQNFLSCGCLLNASENS